MRPDGEIVWSYDASTMNGNQGKERGTCVSAAGKWPDHGG